MTLKVDGTNGVLQAYAYNVPTSGFTYTVPVGTQVVIFDPATTLLSGTVILPAAPSDGMVVTISSSQQITNFTVQANSGQSIVASPTLFLANYSVAYIYKLSTTKWYAVQTLYQNGYQLVQDTRLTSLSTSFAFTGIPSWAKRVTMMLNQVSLTTGATTNMLIQLGTSGGYSNAQYVGNSSYVSSGAASANFTTGFGINNVSNAGYSVSGTVTLNQQDSATNTWTASGVLSGISGSTYITIFTSGVQSLSGSLQRIRLTTVTGSDTFDAGSVNIMYE